MDRETCESSLYLVSKLQLVISLYEGGILRVSIDEQQVNPNRFRLSANEMNGAIINWDALTQLDISSLITSRNDK